MTEHNKKIIYWFSQITGWGLFVIISGISKYLESGLSNIAIILLLLIFIIGLCLSHIYRNFIIHHHWLQLNIPVLLPRVIFSASALAAVMTLSQIVLSYLMQGEITLEKMLLKPQEIILIWINWLIIFVIWSIIYFAVHFFEKSRNEEIKNLKLESMRKEVELNNLKAQLNPHFMFNALNSIRALIDENPHTAKESITGLSNILRNSLLLGKKQLISIKEELDIIQDYLALEKVRYEERLRFNIHCPQDLYNLLIPPLIIQTLTENAIKHGISKLTQGGQIDINIFIENQKLCIKVSNSGTLQNTTKSNTGIGLSNTQQRLELLFNNQYTFKIYSEKNIPKVTAYITMPLVNYANLKTYNIQI
jgi:sensor histidine kinase YesM